jgi:hypothetical protein
MKKYLIIFPLLTATLLFGHKEKWDANKSHWTEIMKYAYTNDTLKIDGLLQNKTDINQRDKNGWTALIVATKKGNTKTVSYLLRHSANPNSIDNNGHSALMEACIFNKYKIAELLLNFKADPNAKLLNGWTALMGAASFADIKMLQLLIDNKADVTAESVGRTALTLANSKEKKELLRKYIIKHIFYDLPLDKSRPEIRKTLLTDNRFKSTNTDTNDFTTSWSTFIGLCSDQGVIKSTPDSIEIELTFGSSSTFSKKRKKHTSLTYVKIRYFYSSLDSVELEYNRIANMLRPIFTDTTLTGIDTVFSDSSVRSQFKAKGMTFRNANSNYSVELLSAIITKNYYGLFIEYTREDK